MTTSEAVCGGAHASSPLWTSPSVGRPEQRLQHGLTPWVASCDQLLVGQALAGHPVHETIEPRQRVPLDVAVVQPEGELINIGELYTLLPPLIL